jgi:hypothetical protein
MPATTPCIRCGTAGFVRREQVLARGMAETHYYCGRCDHGWATRDSSAIRGDENTGGSPGDDDDAPDRGRDD